MITIEAIITEIQNVIQDDAWGFSDLERIVEQGLLTLAGGVILPGRYQLTPPLPSLYTVGTVDTVLGSGVTDLPVNFQRDVVQVADADGAPIPVEPSFKTFLTKHPRLSAGSIRACAVHGSRLLYRDVPNPIQTLTVHYYAAPEDIGCLPSHLRLPLLQAYACAYIFNQIEDGLEASRKVNTQSWRERFFQALLDLEMVFGTDGTPMLIGNETARII